MIRLAHPTVFAFLLLAGCAAAPPQAVHSGALPSSGQYRIEETEQVAPDLRGGISQRLQLLGLAENSEGGLLIQVAEERRPGNVYGASLNKGVATPAQIANGGRLMSALTVTITDAKTGQEVYRATAQTRASRQRAADLQRLLDQTLPSVTREAR